MVDTTDNAFLQVLRTAVAQNWCLKPYCTTCGAQEFRSALREAGGAPSRTLMNALTDLDLEDLTSIPGCADALQIALGDLPFPEQRISLLEAWLPRAHQNLRFFNFVHYRFIRYLPVGHPVEQLGYNGPFYRG